MGTRAPLSAGARQAARVRRRLALFVVATVTVAAGFALAVGLLDSTTAAGDDDDDDGGAAAPATDDGAAPPAATGCTEFCLYLESDAYGQVHANAEGLYPWQVVEPFRETTLSLYGSTYDTFARNGARTPPAAGTGIGVIRWSVRKEGAAAQAANHTRMEGASIRYRFEHVGSAYTVRATLRRAATGAEVTELRETVLCKYVKREIRAMVAEDRRALFRAYNVLYRTADMAAGVAKYGPDFRTALYFVEKHMDRMTKNGCTPYHDSAVFLPAHLAFNLHLLSDAARPDAFNASRGYTNEELMLLFDPGNPKLPYVYETLAFDHCGDREKLAAEVRGLYERSRAAPVAATAGTWPWETDDEDVARVMRRGEISHRLWGLARRWGAAAAAA